MLPRSGMFLLAAVLPLAFASPSAFADPYTFDSTGAFSAIAGGTALSGNEFEWGGTFSRHGTYHNDGSTMTAVPLLNQSGSTPAVADTIGELTWYNASTSSDKTSATVTASYALTLDFSEPLPGGTSSSTFTLTIKNTANSFLVCGFGVFVGGCDDTTTVGGGGPITVDGLSLSNISFFADHGSSFDGGTGIWSNPEDNTAHLFIKANVSLVPPTPPAPPAAVPEPASLALLASGLLGLGLATRRQQRVSP